MEPERAIQVSTEEQISQMYSVWKASLLNQLLDRYGDELVESITPEIEERFYELVADLPYIGGEANPLTHSLIRSAYWLAVYQSIKKYGKNVIEVGELIYEDFQQNIACYSQEELHSKGQERFTEEYIQQQKQLAFETQKCEYEGNWVYYFLDGDGEEFDYGFDIAKCGICTFYHKHGADELAQFICLLDFCTSEKMCLGLERNQTIADGFDVCNFRYKYGRVTQMNWTPDFLKK